MTPSGEASPARRRERFGRSTRLSRGLTTRASNPGTTASLVDVRRQSPVIATALTTRNGGRGGAYAPVRLPQARQFGAQAFGLAGFGEKPPVGKVAAYLSMQGGIAVPRPPRKTNTAAARRRQGDSPRVVVAPTPTQHTNSSHKAGPAEASIVATEEEERSKASQDEHGAKAKALLEEAKQLVVQAMERRNRVAASREAAKGQAERAKPGVLSNEDVKRILGY